MAKSDPRRGAEHPSSLSEKKEAKKEKGRENHRAGFPPPVSYSPAKYASVSATFRNISCRSASKDGNFTSPRSRL